MRRCAVPPRHWMENKFLRPGINNRIINGKQFVISFFYEHARRCEQKKPSQNVNNITVLFFFFIVEISLKISQRCCAVRRENRDPHPGLETKKKCGRFFFFFLNFSIVLQLVRFSFYRTAIWQQTRK